jgi:hypothetical protein
MSKYYYFSHEPSDEDIKLYEYLAAKNENFKLYMYEKLTPGLERFNIEKVFQYHTTFGLDSPEYSSAESFKIRSKN